MRDIKLLVVHCSATKANQKCDASIIGRWHMANGWDEIGYHVVINRNGSIEPGRPLEKPGAHARGFNRHSIGICLCGGLDENGKPENNFTVAQFKSLAFVLKVFKAIHPKADILGHRDLPHVKKACPCFDVRKWIKENFGWES